jgi:hypothetical protein
MNLHQLIPERVINRIPHLAARLIRTAFAAAFPEIFEKMPQHLLGVYLGFSPQNLSKIKYFVPALLATVACYNKELIGRFTHDAMYTRGGLECCPCQ